MPAAAGACMESAMFPWTKITGLGDTNLMAPAALLIGLWLLLARRPRELGWWCLLLALAMALVSATKIAFIGWGIGIPALNFTGISGHTTFALAVLPVMTFLLLQHRPMALRRAGVAAGLLCGLLVGVSRLVLGFHSTSEVVSGALLGTAVSLGFIRVAGSLRVHSLKPVLVGCSFAVLAAASTLQAAPTQHLFVRVALYMSGHEQPYVRGRLPRYPAQAGDGWRPALFRFPAPDCMARAR